MASRPLPTLDGWRGIAILAVLCAHIRWPIPAMVRLGQYGAMGVHLFFALSGFLITTRLIEERQSAGRVDWTNFYIRRAFRILPPAFLYLAAIAVLGLGLHAIPTSWGQLAASAFFYRNYYSSMIPEPRYTAHFWSLAVEEHFYFLWPLVLRLAGWRRALWAAPLLGVGVGIWRALDEHFNWVASLDPGLRGSVWRTDYRLDTLFFGCAAALLWLHPSVQSMLRRIAGSTLVFTVLAGTVACLYWQPPAYLTMLAILMVLLPVATVARPESTIGRLLDSPVLSFVGRISYSLYLWQELFFPVFGVQATLGWVQDWPWNLVPAFGIAVLSYYFVEGPSIAYGKKIQRRRAGASREIAAHAGSRL
jgi:peptidoglycan/LPS O-acetylase OafA/YrhL